MIKCLLCESEEVIRHKPQFSDPQLLYKEVYECPNCGYVDAKDVRIIEVEKRRHHG